MLEKIKRSTLFFAILLIITTSIFLVLHLLDISNFNINEYIKVISILFVIYLTSLSIVALLNTKPSDKL